MRFSQHTYWQNVSVCKYKKRILKHVCACSLNPRASAAHTRTDYIYTHTQKKALSLSETIDSRARSLRDLSLSHTHACMYIQQITPQSVREQCWKVLKSGRVIPGYGHAVLRRTDPRFTCQAEVGVIVVSIADMCVLLTHRHMFVYTLQRWVALNPCMYVNIHVCIHACMYVCIHTCMYARSHLGDIHV